MSTPLVPARPARTTQQTGPSAVKQEPAIPPRPIRKTDPSPSRSPLNFLPGSNGGIGRPPSRPSSNLAPDAPRRPPSVSFPSDAGQEGAEYDSYDQLPPEAHGVSGEGSELTRNVSADMPLHAPRASFAQSTAKNRIASVTRTDSTQAAAAGIGKARPDDDVHRTPVDTQPLSRVTSRTNERPPSTEPHPLRARASFSRSSSSLPSGGTPRPASVHSVDHFDGIPTHGLHVPLLADRGDVQAPSPGPVQSQHAPGIGFFNDGSSRNHHRKRSSRHEFGPPDSYGLHGHGMLPQDQFERDWIQKHPDLAAKEGYATYTPRPSTALSTEQLNKLVHMNEAAGIGTNRNMTGTPTQQEIAFDATDIYTARKTRGSSGQQQAVESSLKKTLSAEPAGGSVLDSEDEHTYHIIPNYGNGNKITGGGIYDNVADLGPHGGNTSEEGGWINERGDGTPILASDEIIKRPGSAYQEPAVNLEYHDYDGTGRRSSLQTPSRPSSRPNSVHGSVGNYHGGPLHRYTSHEHHDVSGMGTPLEEIEEYEPLFPEDGNDVKHKAVLKIRPSLAHHHFPSQDIWEDTPSSLQYEATVETPEPPHEEIAAMDAKPEAVFETPEQEQQRRDDNPNDMLSSDKTFTKPHFKTGIEEELHVNRPGVQRFPSRDIWEDSPDSMRLETIVSGPQMDEIMSPPEDRPTTTALPGNQDDGEARMTTDMPSLPKPSIPARPERRSKLAQEISSDLDPREKEVSDLGVSKTSSSPEKTRAPSIPDRPKPSIPARPVRSSNAENAEGAPLSKSVSETSSNDTVTSPHLPKAKPVVPARPSGGKIAALKAGFMNDLNNRLQIGPQGPPPKAKEPEPELAEETEKAPLADARKGRAKGPARRKPASSPTGAANGSQLGFFFSFSSPLTLFQIDESDELTVGAAEESRPGVAEVEKVLSANTVSNISDDAPLAGGPEPSFEDKLALAHQAEENIGAEGGLPEPSIAASSMEKEKMIEPEFEASLASAEAAVAALEKQVVSSKEANQTPEEGYVVVKKAEEERV